MFLVFNEISAQDFFCKDKYKAQDLMSQILQVCKKVSPKGFNRLRFRNDYFEIRLCEGYSILDWCNDQVVSRTERELFLGFRQNPYIQSDESEIEDDFISTNFFLNEPIHPSHEHSVEGLGVAFLCDTLAVSFCSHILWHTSLIGLKRQIDDDENFVKAYNVCCADCLEEPEIIEWLRFKVRRPIIDRASVDSWYSPADGFRLSDKAKDDLIYWFAQNRLDILNEIHNLVKEILIDPFHGTGKPEPLKRSQNWSRRITHGDRFIYRREGEFLFIENLKGHYGDK